MRTFNLSDVTRVLAFFTDVIAVPWTWATDGSRVLVYAPGELGIHPRGLSIAERAMLGPSVLALTCEDVPGILAELSAGGAVLTSAGLTSRHDLTATLQITPDQAILLVAG